MIKEDYTIKAKPTTVRNSQANAIVERVHQVIGNIIWTFELESNYLDKESPWKEILSATAFCWFAVQSTFHTTLRSTPGQLVFGRDMMFNTKKSKLGIKRKRKQPIIEKNNEAENDRHIPHT
jgi:hypothetical protein